jgi:hypothetical protein
MSLPSSEPISYNNDLLPPVGLADNKVEPEDLLQERGEGQRQQPQPQYEENLQTKTISNVVFASSNFPPFFLYLLVEDIDWKYAESVQLLDSTTGTIHVQATLRHLQFYVFN